MFWKLGFLVIFVLGTAGYVLWAVRVAVPQIGYFTAAAAGRHVSHRVQILKVKENADDAVGGGNSTVTYSWKVLLTGGPLGQARENVTMEEAPAKVVAAAGELRPGRWVPAVYYFGQWLPVPVVKWDTLACGGGPLLALGVIGLILRCVIGPRALPNHYEPATRDYSADFTGVPTLRPALLGVVGLIGFLALSTGLLGKRVVAPGSHFCYWLAMLGLSLFLISGPVVIWCVLPHFHRVIAPDG